MNHFGTYQIVGYLIPAAWILGFEMFAVFNTRPRDTITAMTESTAALWLPVVVLCAWSLGHFTFGVWAERAFGITAAVFAPLVWCPQRPSRRTRT